MLRENYWIGVKQTLNKKKSMASWGSRSLNKLTETIIDMESKAAIKLKLDLAPISRGMCLVQVRARQISIWTNFILRQQMPRCNNQKLSMVDFILTSTQHLTKTCCWINLQKNLWARLRSIQDKYATKCFSKTWNQRSTIKTSKYILGCKYSITRKG